MMFFLWLAIFGTAIAGYALTTLRSDIKLRLHKIWTPVGILMIIWVWYFMVTIALPNSISLADLLLNQSSETYLFVASFGLLIAFVEPKVLYKYAFYFIPVTLFFLFYQLLGAIIQLPIVLIQRGLSITTEQINEMNDIFALLTVPLYSYYIIKKFRLERPTWRKTALTVGIFLAVFIVLMIFTGVVLIRLPPSNWLFQWLRG